MYVCITICKQCVFVHCQFVSVLSPRQISLHLLCMEIKFVLIPNLFCSSLPRFTLSQPFPPRRAASSPAWTKHRSCWNGAIRGTWADGKTSSTTWYARSVFLSGERARGVMTTWKSHRGTWAWPNGAWRSAICKPTRSTALKSRRSTAFPTRAPIHLNSLRWTSPQIRPVGAAAASWIPVKDHYCICRCCQHRQAGIKISLNVREYIQLKSVSCMYVGVCYIFCLWTGIEKGDILLNELRKRPFSHAHSTLCANAAANSNTVQCVLKIEPSRCPLLPTRRASSPQQQR